MNATNPFSELSAESDISTLAQIASNEVPPTDETFLPPEEQNESDNFVD